MAWDRKRNWHFPFPIRRGRDYLTIKRGTLPIVARIIYPLLEGLHVVNLLCVFNQLLFLVTVAESAVWLPPEYCYRPPGIRKRLLFFTRYQYVVHISFLRSDFSFLPVLSSKTSIQSVSFKYSAAAQYFLYFGCNRTNKDKDCFSPTLCFFFIEGVPQCETVRNK